MLHECIIWCIIWCTNAKRSIKFSPFQFKVVGLRGRADLMVHHFLCQCTISCNLLHDLSLFVHFMHHIIRPFFHASFFMSMHHFFAMVHQKVHSEGVDFGKTVFRSKILESRPFRAKLFSSINHCVCYLLYGAS
jgi:hypothetical protein